MIGARHRPQRGGGKGPGGGVSTPTHVPPDLPPDALITLGMCIFVGLPPSLRPLQVLSAAHLRTLGRASPVSKPPTPRPPQSP